MQFAAVIRPVECQQTGLGADEGKRVGGAHAAAVDAARIRIKAAGNIDGEYRCAVLVDESYPLGVATFNGAREADTEQAVDHEAASVRRGERVGDRTACGPPALMGGSGIRRQCRNVAAKDDGDGIKPLLEVTRGHERVAAVVAGAGEQQYRFAAVGGQRAGELCGGQARPFHQRRGDTGMARLDAAYVSRQIEWGAVTDVDLHANKCSGKAL